MSRQLEVQQEERESARCSAFVKAVEYGLVGDLASQGMELTGFSIKYEESACFMVVRAKSDSVHSVCFVWSDTIMNCILKASSAAHHHRLKWKVDQYHT